MSKMVLMGLVATMMSGLLVTEAMAQRDAGAKARGDMRSFWDPGYQRSPGVMRYYRAARPASEGYRRFSYEPTNIRPGDTAVVRDDNVQMMRGKDVVGTVPKGTEFKVTKEIDGWLGAVVDVNGQHLDGWIWNDKVTLKQEAPAAAPQSARGEMQQGRSYRRYSYDPSNVRTSRGYTRTKAPWQYPKTDPRRYRP